MSFIQKLFANATFIFFVLYSSVSFSDVSPNALLNRVGQQIFSQIAQIDADDKIQKRAELKQLIKTELFPYVDLNFISFKLLGKHIRDIKKSEIPDFVAAVTEHLSGTYANALMAYKDQQVLFDQSEHLVDGKYATVKAVIISETAPAIDLQFKLRQNEDGNWKIYDLVAEGVSLLSAKQKEIIRRISDVGLNQVIEELKQS